MEGNDAIILSEHLHEVCKHPFMISWKKKRYFKLCNYSPGSKARLEGYSTEARSLIQPPDSIILMHNVAKIQPATDIENSILIVEDGKITTLQARSEERQQIWLHALQALLLHSQVVSSESESDETINEVYFFPDQENRTSKSYAAQIRSGNLLHKLDTSKVFLRFSNGKVQILDQKRQQRHAWNLRSIRSFSIIQNNILKIETGRRAEGGEDIVQFEMSQTEKKEFYKLMVKEKDELSIRSYIEQTKYRSESSPALSLPPPIAEASLRTQRSLSLSRTKDIVNLNDKRTSCDGVLDQRSKSLQDDDEEEVYWNSDDDYTMPEAKSTDKLTRNKPEANKQKKLPPLPILPKPRTLKSPLIKSKCINDESDEEIYQDPLEEEDRVDVIYSKEVDKNLNITTKTDGKRVLIKPLKEAPRPQQKTISMPLPQKCTIYAKPNKSSSKG